MIEFIRNEYFKTLLEAISLGVSDIKHDALEKVQDFETLMNLVDSDRELLLMMITRKIQFIKFDQDEKELLDSELNKLIKKEE